MAHIDPFCMPSGILRLQQHGLWITYVEAHPGLVMRLEGALDGGVGPIDKYEQTTNNPTIAVVSSSPVVCTSMEKHTWQPVHLQGYENVPRLDGTGNKRPRIHLTPTRLLSQHAIPSRRRWSTWALPALVSLCIVVLWNASWQPTASREPQRKSNGLTDVVQWDNYTLFLHGQRMFLHSGEFHTFRLPVPELWLDVFQKMVAVGFNSVSVYIHMGLTNPSRGVMDFDDWRSLEAMYDAAKLTGLFVVLRPGPYINAETTAGGISAWITAETPSVVRTNATDWFDAYEPFIDAIIDGTKAHQVTEGGAVLAIQIDNEYEQNEVTGAYFERLEEQYRKNGIIVPLTYNDPNMRRAFVNGTGAVDIYGMDAYPQRFDCSHPSVWNPVVTNYHQYHSEVNPSQPWYMPEYQAGAFDPWGGPGYDACFELTGPEFEDVFYKQNWAANAKLLSYYMFYGGTNWGGLAEPDVYTSYDYGSPMRETRLLSKKYDEIKRQGLFIRSSPEFRKTDWVGDSSTGVPELSLSNDAAFVTYLRNPDSGTGFFIVRQDNSTTTEPLSFQITVPCHQPNGRLTLPLTLDAIALDGRQSKVIITNYHFGKHGHLVYTTAEVFFAGRIGARDVLFLQGRATQAHEFSMTLVASRRPGSSPPFADPRVRHHAAAINGAPTVFTVLPGTTGLVTVWECAGQLVLYADADTAATFWAPHVPAPTANTVPGWEHFWQWGTNETVLVGGPYLVRNASVEHGTLKLRGDLEKEVMLTVIAPEDVTRVTWNGDAVDVLADLHGASAVRTGKLAMKGRARGFVLPELKGWKYHDSLPEIEKDFDDSEWITANKTVTYSYQQPLFGDGAVLYGCDYGFCENTVFLRGHFDANGSETGANLTIFGGDYFAASVWINDKFIASVQSSTDHANYIFTFPEGSVVAGEENVLTVLYDNQGLDESENEKSARGIAGYVLEGGNFTMWKVQGKAGGYTNYPDKLRGLLNEGGLYAERQGWHLPVFDTSSWDSRELSAGLPGGTAGVGFFVATFELDVPSETDVPMSFQFEPDGQPYRALLFVNGWQYGKRIANVGPQTRFPVPQGILNYNGKNTVAIALWATNNTAVSPGLALEIDGWLEDLTCPIDRKTLRDCLYSRTWYEHECGRTSRAACFDALGAQFSIDPPELEAAWAQVVAQLAPSEEMLALVRELRAHWPGVRVFGAFNVSQADYATIYGTGAEWDVFDAVFTSHELGSRMPNLGFFRRVFEGAGGWRLAARDTVYVGHDADDVVTAKTFGAHGILLTDVKTARRELWNLAGDPVKRGREYLRANAGKLVCEVDGSDVSVVETFSQLLILEATGDRSLVTLQEPDWFWNFFPGGKGVFTSEKYPDDLDTTSLGLVVLKRSKEHVNPIMDEMLTFLSDDGLPYTYFDRERPRVDPGIVVNILRFFYTYGRGHELPDALAFIRRMLLHRAYIDGTRYYSRECFLFFVSRLLDAGHDDAHLQGALRDLFTARVREIVGGPGDAIALALRVVICARFGVRNEVDMRALLPRQEEDGGWEVGWMYHYGISKMKIGNRGYTTAMALKAVEELDKLRERDGALDDEF
ncbi:uncharacterized protein BXZ73DRAFT_105011 [Epithele typhae]|uniref:uncharacterized protein n=1 Tax=Epithele typhae TaxID=378194 RepID=UPI002008E488|nr:uncharacterized protein BXZ73DRAFT_105011 [Epithele typhae]KAH9919182.1 hypothetical protein BXZ73DRAFT_105011 [Epithele typhae]